MAKRRTPAQKAATARLIAGNRKRARRSTIAKRASRRRGGKKVAPHKGVRDAKPCHECGHVHTAKAHKAHGHGAFWRTHKMRVNMMTGEVKFKT